VIITHIGRIFSSFQKSLDEAVEYAADVKIRSNSRKEEWDVQKKEYERIILQVRIISTIHNTYLSNF
jgi:hypothetical protein